MNLEIVNPLEIPDWDDLVLATGKASFFHTAAWARVLSESYGYKPLYFTLRENARILGLMPFMEVNSYLTGKRGVSLPFSDHCQSLCSDKEHFQEMYRGVIEYARNAGWKYIEWRDAGHFLDWETPLSRYHLHILDLDRELPEILASFRDSTRRNISSSKKKGVKVDFYQSPDSVKTFYKLHCLTRRWHGFPPQPYSFFKKIHEHVISANRGIVVLASFQHTAVAGAIFLHFGDKAMFKYGASERKHHDLRPNNLVMWEAIRWYKGKSFRSLDFGRTRLEDSGLLQFKAGWGAANGGILYHKYDLRKNAFVEDRQRLGIASHFAKALPLPIFIMVGSLLYKHLG